MNELEELREQARKDRAVELSKRKELYRYARGKGFTSIEARILSATNKEKINRLSLLL